MAEIIESFTFTADGQPVEVELSIQGEGRPVLLLPALSSISTRHEMDGLAAVLSADFRTIAADWPGFGETAKPGVKWTPALLSAYLDALLAHLAPAPFAIVAAGHAATYAYHHLARHPGATQRLVSLAPTWRGPFPTMMGGQKSWFSSVRSALDAPGVGPVLYAVNMSPPVMNMMVGGHVYVDRDWMPEATRASKKAVVDAPGARFGSVRFVSGGLDRVESREDFLALARQIAVPHLVLYGARTPRRSRAEMDALAELPNVESRVLDRGKLSFYEEFSPDAAPVVAEFLKRHGG